MLVEMKEGLRLGLLLSIGARIGKLRGLSSVAVEIHDINCNEIDSPGNEFLYRDLSNK
jgi:hypothetical protein